MIVDPHEHERHWREWIAKGSPLDGVSKKNREHILQFLKDMELGLNVSISSKKGSRGPGRLLNLRSKLKTLTIILQDELKIDDFIKLEGKDREILELIKKAREKKIISKHNKGKPLASVGTYVKILKTFWHWYQRTEKKKGRQIEDITEYMDGRDNKPKFNYLTIEQVKQLCDMAKYEYKVLMMFLMDTGIRAPKELMNVQIIDLEWNEKDAHYYLTIKEESSKTFGRKIKLLLCSEILRQYIKNKKFSTNSYLFKIDQHTVNLYLKNLGFKVLNIGMAEKKIWGKNKQKFVSIKDGLTMYDFRHCSACYWLLRYKSESALKYRFGWKKSDMINYYTEFLGMKDTIQDDDLYVDISKTDLENKLNDEKKERILLQERLEMQEKLSKENQVEMDRKMEELSEGVKANVLKQTDIDLTDPKQIKSLIAALRQLEKSRE